MQIHINSEESEQMDGTLFRRHLQAGLPKRPRRNKFFSRIPFPLGRVCTAPEHRTPIAGGEARGQAEAVIGVPFPFRYTALTSPSWCLARNRLSLPVWRLAF